ncbi:MAG: hypothetical protein ACKVHP_07285 [Verrucomicrobiales bacterium]|jgi:hypothetical protein
MHGPLLYVPTGNQIEIIEQADSLSEADTVSLNGWSNSSLDALSGLMIRRTGQVTHVKENEVFYIRHKSRVARIRSASCQILSVGEHCEVVGVVESNRNGFIQLRSLSARKIDYQPLEAPVEVYSPNDVLTKLPEAQYISVRGDLVSTHSNGKEHTLTLREDNISFDAQFEATPKEFAELRLDQSRTLQVDGVCDLSSNDGSFLLHVNSTHNVHVLTQRISSGFKLSLILLGLVGFIAFSSVVWVKQLKLQVAKKTRHLQEITARLRSSPQMKRSMTPLSSPITKESFLRSIATPKPSLAQK